LEVDENQHRYGYESVGCDMRRMSRVTEAVAIESLSNLSSPPEIVWMRYNPDTFRVGNVIVRTMPKEKREQWLGSHILQMTSSDTLETMDMKLDQDTTATIFSRFMCARSLMQLAKTPASSLAQTNRAPISIQYAFYNKAENNSKLPLVCSSGDYNPVLKTVASDVTPKTF
jgi:hypothetical protein